MSGEEPCFAQFCTRGGSGATASPFRRNGIAVPAQRHHRSGATASPFRRSGFAQGNAKTGRRTTPGRDKGCARALAVGPARLNCLVRDNRDEQDEWDK